MPSFVILGARNLGGAIADQLLALGFQGAAIARSDDTLEAVRARGLTAVQADVMEPEQLASALRQAAAALGHVDVVINAVSVAQFDPQVPWGGGPLLQADLARWEAWGGAIGRQALVFQSETGRFLTEQGGPAKVVQVGNNSMREPTPGMGIWSAGWHSVFALAAVARAEWADAGIQVGVARVVGPILSPKTEAMLANVPPEMVNDQDDVAAKIAAYAAGDQLEPELVVTPR